MGRVGWGLEDDLVMSIVAVLLGIEDGPAFPIRGLCAEVGAME